jgi:hypothetical protein
MSTAWDHSQSAGVSRSGSSKSASMAPATPQAVASALHSSSTRVLPRCVVCSLCLPYLRIWERPLIARINSRRYRECVDNGPLAHLPFVTHAGKECLHFSSRDTAASADVVIPSHVQAPQLENAKRRDHKRRRREAWANRRCHHPSAGAKAATATVPSVAADMMASPSREIVPTATAYDILQPGNTKIVCKT